MTVDQEHKQQALQKAKTLIAEGEKQRLNMRMMRQIEGFAQGDSSVLSHDEFVSNVSQVIHEAAHIGDHGRAEMLVQQLESYACGEDISLRERAVMALSFCSGLLSPDEDYALLVQVSMAMAHWLEVEKTYVPSCDTVCRQLQRNGLRMLNEGHWQHFEPLQDILFRIYSGVLEKGNIIRGLASRTLDGLAISHILEELVLVCQHGQGGRQPLAEKILAHFGCRAITFLLDKLLVSQQKNDRIYFLKLIQKTGELPVPVLKEYLNKDLPWYGFRNIVALIMVWGDVSHIPLVLPLLKHRDMRVQQQVIDCLDNISGDEKKKYLLAALPVVHDEIKVRIIAKIGQLGCTAECMDILLDLLSERDSFAPHVHDELLSQLCMVLLLTPQRRTVTLLRQVLDERVAQRKAGNDSISDIVQQTLQSLESQLQPVQQPAAPQDVEEQIQVSFASDPHAEQVARLNLRDLESKIEKLLQMKKIGEATQFIAERAITAAKNNDFVTAEILRDRIFAIDPNALLEVIRVSELIANEKKSTINSHDLSLWSELHDVLDSDAFSALYHCQRSLRYQQGDVIIQQGAAKAILYFINEGQVNLSYQQGQKTISLNNLNPGDIVGVASFFDASVWTESLTAITAVQMRILERQTFQQLLPQYPGLESQLTDFCRRFDNVPDLLRISGQSRRENKRDHAEQVVACNLLDEHGQATPQKFRGHLENISHGGLAFLIRLSKKENAQLFLGRYLELSLQGGNHNLIKTKGLVVGVSLQNVFNSDYLMHMRFDKPMNKEDIKSIIQQGAQGV